MSSPEGVDEKTPIRLITWQPTFDVAYVRRLEYDRAGLSSRDITHNAVVARLQLENENARTWCMQLEGRLDASELTVNRQKQEVNREKEKSKKLECTNQQLRRKIGWLERDIAAKERELAASKLAVKTSLEAASRTMEEHKTTQPDVPTFEILSQGSLDGPGETSHVLIKGSNDSAKVVTPLVKDVSPQRVAALEAQLAESQGALAVCETQLEMLRQEKVNEVARLEERNTNLGDVINGVKRTWDGLKKANSLLTIKADGLSTELEKLRETVKENRERIAQLEVENNELVLRNRTMQARLEELEPRYVKEDVIFSPISVVKTVRTRHASKNLTISEPGNTEKCAGNVQRNIRGKNKYSKGATKKGKNVVEGPIELGDDSDNTEILNEMHDPIRNANIYKLKISRYLPEDLKFRIESLWAKTSAQ